MSKMADMKQTIEDLRSSAAAINDAADWLYQQFSGTDDSDKQQNSKTAATKDEQPELKLENVRSVLAGKSRAGHTAEVRDLLQKYGATKLSAIAALPWSKDISPSPHICCFRNFWMTTARTNGNWDCFLGMPS